jgi:phosphosulfolactate synthase
MFLSQILDPTRTRKPRTSGLTQILDKGLSLEALNGILDIASPWIDIVKLGWCTAAVSNNVEAKIRAIQKKGITICCGGTLFEAAVSKNLLEEYVAFLRDLDIRHIEVSDGTIEIDPKVKLQYVERLAKTFTVFSEIGKKDRRVPVLAPSEIAQKAEAQLAAGAAYAVLEGRESGNVGIYHADGAVKEGLIREVTNRIPLEKIIFEAPQKNQQVWFVRELGCNVNLGNVAPEEAISLETIRQGLRSDTFGPPKVSTQDL